MEKVVFEAYDEESQQYLAQNQGFKNKLKKLMTNLDWVVKVEFATWKKQKQKFRINCYFYDNDLKIITVFSSDQNQLLNRQMWLNLNRLLENPHLSCYYQADVKNLTFSTDFEQSLVWNFELPVENYTGEQIDQLGQNLVKIVQFYQKEKPKEIVFNLNKQKQILIKQNQDLSDLKTLDFTFMKTN